MDRRAFGEFIGPRGELASYAFGWKTDADDEAGRLTVGIGAGNPGGATVHAAVFNNDGRPGFSLIDEPFESVPEGGPHRTRDEALSLEDLPFIWWVADHVILSDSRAMWMCHWVLGTRAILTPQVFELTEPILFVINGNDGELWQLVGSTDASSEYKLAHLSHSVDEDPTLVEVLNLAPGQEAVRDKVGGRWTRSATAVED